MVKWFEGPAKPPAPVPGAAAAQEVPEGVKQFEKMANSLLPTIENITGLTRREIALHLLKTGVKGGSIDTFLNGLMGTPAAKEIKFVRVVKTLAIWVPVGLGLTCLVIMCLYFFLLLMIRLMGALPL